MTGAVQGNSGRGGTTAKRQALLEGALVVFARDGFARASIEAIAETSRVSTRTIYNHFLDKGALFAAVVEHSALAVSNAHIERIDTLLGAITGLDDLEPALVACGLALQTVVPPEAPHWGLMRNVHADAQHIAPVVIDTWRRVGPARVKRQLGLHLADLDRRRFLQLDDPQTAAIHYSALTGSVWGSAVEPDPSEERAATLMSLAVAVFLHGYAPRGERH